jgi:trimeric autotransporter adhesin
MKKIFMRIVNSLLLILTFGVSYAQNVSVSGALIGNGLYSDLGSAFIAINGGSQTGAAIVISILGNTIEPATATLNAGTWTSLSITPAGGATRVISGNIAGPLISFNGAARVLVDGLNTSGNGLNIDNTNNTTASTIQFINDAKRIAINKTAIFGANTAITSGTVFFSTGAVSGNDSIGFDACIIGASGSNFHVNGVASIGSTIVGQENSSIVFNACNIENFFSPGSLSVGILAGAGNTDWTISNCKFFQTVGRVYTTANTHRVIQISSGNSHSIIGNTIGYNSASASGTYIMTSTVATRLTAIELSTATGDTSVINNNTITAITLGTSSGAATTNGIICGINILGSGSVKAEGNTIGASTGINAIVATPTTTQGAVVGIHVGATGYASIQNNTIGALTSSGATATVAGGVFGINVSGGAKILINNNTIGNATADNMRGGTSGLTTGSSIVAGINISSTTAINPVVSNNIIQNLSSYGTGTTGYARGIFTAAITGNLNTHTYQGNTIRFLTTNSASTTISNGQSALMGISTSVGSNNIIRNNTIHSLSNTNTAATQSYVVGIGHGNATNTTITGNTIYNLANSGTSTTTSAPSVIAGILVRSGTTAVNINNNMISLGNGQTTNSVIIGIQLNNGSTPDPTSNIYNNTINIEGTVSGGISAQPSFGIARTDFSITARTAAVDIRNNIVTNTRTGGIGVHAAIVNNYLATAATATGWGTNASNSNVLNASNPANLAWWNSAMNFATWKSTSVCDAGSFSGIPVTYINSANDLHLNMGLTATVLESNGQTIPSVTTDIDNQSRPGPTGSVNGGGSAYDIGADEFDGVFLDAAVPNITYALLPFTCTTGDRTFTATITDGTGVPTSGALQPRVYFNKNNGAWFSSQGVLASGTAQNGTWTFTINAASMGGLAIGDVVAYYVIAQDASPSSNITSNPPAGLVATNVNTVSTPPSTPNTYSITGFLNGNYNVGTSGAYTTLTAAANAYSNSCLSGPVTFTLTDPTYPAEVYPIVLNANSFASSVNTLTIKPSANTLISGSSAGAILQINGGDYIIVDGTNSNTINSICPTVRASRNLTLENTNTSTTSAVISINTNNNNKPASHNKVMNTIIVGNASLTTGVGVNIGGPTIGSGVGSNGNAFNEVINDSIIKAQVGVFESGVSATSKSLSTKIDLNVMTASGTNAIGRFGIMSLFSDSVKVRNNKIANIVNTASTDVVAISLGSNALSNTLTASAEATNALVIANDIDSIRQTNTYSAGGIIIAATTIGNTVVANNTINRVFSNGTGGDFAVGIYYGGGAGALKAYNNTVRISGTLTGASQPNMAIGINGTNPNLDIKNNILICEGSNGLNGNTGIGLAYSAPYSNLMSNNNDIYVSGTSSSIGRTGGLVTGTQRITLLDWQTETGTDISSINIAPTFISNSDLHLLAGANAGIEQGGAIVASVTIDRDCEPRPISNNPDMGSDEVCNPASIATLAVAASDTTICAGTSVTLSVVSGSLNDASNWQWYTTSCGGTTSGTGVSITVSPNDTTTYFVRGEGGCVIGTACTSFTINVNDFPTVDAGAASTNVCSGDSLTLSGSGNAVSYAWNNGISNGVAFSPSSTTTYTVTGTSASGCIAKDSIVVNVNAKPNVTASATAAAVCAGSSVTLSGNGASTYAWTNGVSDGVAFTPSSTQTYIVTGTAANGCSDTSSITIAVNANPVVNLGGNQSTCNASLVLDAGNAGSSYLWSTGATSQTINVTSSGTYSVAVTSTSGCTDNDTATITLNSVLVAGISPSTSNVCAGSSAINLVGTPSGGTYSANASGGVFNPTTAGTFTVSYIVSNVCGTDTADAAITVNANPNASVVASGSTICAGGTTALTLAGTPAGGLFSVQSGAASALTGNSFNPATTGNWVIVYTYTDPNTCSDTAQINFNVNCTVGLNDLANGRTTINVFPNPNSGVFQLSIDNAPSDKAEVKILSLEGKVLATYIYDLNAKNKLDIDINQMANGLYILEVKVGSLDQRVRVSKQ